MDKFERELLQRGVAALERLAEDPEIKVETFPPVCPHCEKVNPTVKTVEETNSGPLGRIAIVCTCLECQNVFYALPFQYVCKKTLDEALEVDAERAEASGH